MKKTNAGGTPVLRSLLPVCFMVLVLLGLYVRFTASSLWDDSYMFTRYADSLIAGRGFAFNPDGEPAFGLTSLAQLGVLVPLRLLLPGDPVLPLLLTSLLSGIMFFLFLAAVVRREAEKVREVPGTLATGIIFFSLAFASSDLVVHLTSGMDTMLALAYLCLYLLADTAARRKPSVAAAAGTGFLGGAAVLVRPDLLVFTLCIPAVSLVFSRGEARRMDLIRLVCSAVFLAPLPFLAQRYLNSPVPLAGYVKSPGFYGGGFSSMYRVESLKQLWLFIFAYPVPVGLTALAAAVAPRAWFGSLSPFHRGLLVSSALFTVFELLFVDQIMGMSQRFYYPVLPALLLLSVSSAGFLLGRFGKDSSGGVLSRGQPSRRWAVPAFFIFLFLYKPSEPGRPCYICSFTDIYKQ